MRGFKGTCQDLDTYAGAIRRSGQRFANAVAAANPDFILFSCDDSQAVANGMAIKEFSALMGTYFRDVQFDVSNADLDCLMQIKRF